MVITNPKASALAVVWYCEAEITPIRPSMETGVANTNAAGVGNKKPPPSWQDESGDRK
jgi:hypothetical protein